MRAVNIGGIHHRAGRIAAAALRLSDAGRGARAARRSRRAARWSRRRTCPRARRCRSSELLAGEASRMSDRLLLRSRCSAAPRARRRLLSAGDDLASARRGDARRRVRRRAPATDCSSARTARAASRSRRCPFGASRYPEWGSAAVVGGALFASHPRHAPGALTVGVLAALPRRGSAGGRMVALRRLNGRWAKRALAALEAGQRAAR